MKSKITLPQTNRQQKRIVDKATFNEFKKHYDSCVTGEVIEAVKMIDGVFKLLDKDELDKLKRLASKFGIDPIKNRSMATMQDMRNYNEFISMMNDKYFTKLGL